MAKIVQLPTMMHRFVVVKCKALRLVNPQEGTVRAKRASDIAATLINSGSTGFDYFSVIPLAAGQTVAYRREGREWVPVLTEADVEVYESSFPREVQERELGYFYDETGTRVFPEETA